MPYFRKARMFNSGTGTAKRLNLEYYIENVPLGACTKGAASASVAIPLACLIRLEWAATTVVSGVTKTAGDSYYLEASDPWLAANGANWVNTNDRTLAGKMTLTVAYS